MHLLTYLLTYLTNIKINSAFHPPGVSKLSTGLSGCGQGGAHLPVSGGS